MAVPAQAPTRICATTGDTTSLTNEEQAVASFLNEPSNATFAVIFRLYVPRLIRYFRFRGCSPAVAEELAQDVMLAVHRQAPTLRERQRFRAWLYRIACNILLQSWRKRSREIETVEFDWAADIAHLGGHPLDTLILRESMDSIEPDEREILLLRWVEGLEHHEIAEVLKLPMGTVQWKTFRIRKKLARLVR